MKIAYGNYGMPNTPAQTMVCQLAEIGYDGVELCVGASYPTAPGQLDPTERQELRRSLQEAGIEIASFMVVGMKTLETDPCRHEVNLSGLRAILGLAADLDVTQPVVTSTVGGRVDSEEAQRCAMVDCVRDWAAVCQEEGGCFAFEPHVGGMIHSPSLALWLIEQVDHPGLKVKFDYSHFEAIDVPLDQAISELAPHIVDVHVKDVRGRYPDFRFLLPGEGEVNYADYLRQMSAAGYEGFITVEISGHVSKAEGYDPLKAARFSYRTLADAFAHAGLARG
jgi:inosose dehydratase